MLAKDCFKYLLALAANPGAEQCEWSPALFSLPLPGKWISNFHLPWKLVAQDPLPWCSLPFSYSNACAARSITPRSNAGSSHSFSWQPGSHAAERPSRSRLRVIWISEHFIQMLRGCCSYFRPEKWAGVPKYLSVVLELWSSIILTSVTPLTDKRYCISLNSLPHFYPKTIRSTTPLLIQALYNY